MHCDGRSNHFLGARERWWYYRGSTVEVTGEVQRGKERQEYFLTCDFIVDKKTE